MIITVVITTYQVPFDQVVKSITTFTGDNASEQARQHINQASKLWWDEYNGDEAVKQGKAESYEPVEEIGYNHAHYEIWSGENAFSAMLDEKSYWQLHEQHYKANYDDKGIARPGYLQQAMGVDCTEQVNEIFARFGTKH